MHLMEVQTNRESMYLIKILEKVNEINYLL